VGVGVGVGVQVVGVLEVGGEVGEVLGFGDDRRVGVAVGELL
jgi:hypothetical protein